MKKVLGFSVLNYDRVCLEKLNDTQKNELYLEDWDNTICYDCLDDFFNSLNNDCVDTEGYYFYIVDVD